MERLIDLYNGTAIYKVHVDELRERDINANVMKTETFNRLKANMSEDKRLETLPLCHLKKSDERTELGIISGHHRTRSARMAGITELYVLVIEEELTEDEIKSKQLAHNAIHGQDDEQVLRKIFESIEDVNQKLKSGVYIKEAQEIYERVMVDEMGFDFDYEILRVIFLPIQTENFNQVCKLIEEKEKNLIADYKEFENLKSTIQKVAKTENIKSIAGILSKMSDIVLEYYDKSEDNDG